MDIKLIAKILILTVCILLLVYSVPRVVSKFTSHKKGELHSEIFKVNNGYGYLILNKGKTLIKQDFIPAIAGEKPFSSSKDAKLVANLVLDKLLKGNSPVVRAQEIYDLNIVILKPE